MPHSVEEAREIDRINGNDRWEKSIQKEMSKVAVAFKFLDDGEKVPVGYQTIDCHLVFDIKMNDFSYKSRMVAGGHMTEPPASMTYASVVSRDSVRIALTMAALHDLEVKAADIENAYLTAPYKEKIAVRCGPEFGPNAGKTAILVRALYGLKSSGNAFRTFLAQTMVDLGFTPCKADSDVWMRRETRPDGFKYYSYVLLYVDDILCVHHDAMSILKKIGKRFTLKDGFGDPDLYLGAKI